MLLLFCWAFQNRNKSNTHSHILDSCTHIWLTLSHLLSTHLASFLKWKSISKSVCFPASSNRHVFREKHQTGKQSGIVRSWRRPKHIQGNIKPFAYCCFLLPASCVTLYVHHFRLILHQCCVFCYYACAPTKCAKSLFLWNRLSIKTNTTPFSNIL